LAIKTGIKVAKQNQKSKGQNTSVKQSTAETQAPPPVVTSIRLPAWSTYVIIFLFSVMLYSNTIWNKFAIDDTIVLTDNKFTKKGIAGLKDHFTHDMFEGFFGERGAKLVSGGRYRPLSMASLTLEYELMRRIRNDKRTEITDANVIIGGDSDPYLNPYLSHSINILLFALTCVLLYHVLLQIIPSKYSIKSPIGDLGIPFIATLLYAAHPIHTEAVANIKGRDEVMCMLFSLLSLYATLRYVKTQNIVHLIWGAFVFFITLLSKENAITFIAVIPLTYYFFTKAKPKDYALAVGLYIVPVALFLFLRSKYTQAGLTQDSPEILNNPFLLATTAQRYATTIYTFLLYFKLLVFPHPLTHDYYYNEIPYVDFNDIKFVLSFVVNAALIVYALMNLKKKSIASYAILYYFITFSIASNMLFTVGVLMNERFIYMSSLGFCILAAVLLINAKDRFKLSPNAVLTVLLLVLSLYSIKTFARNYDWKDSFTLFRRDCAKSPNSAKIQTSVGGDLTKAAESNISALRDSGMIKQFFNDLAGGSKTSDELNAIQVLPDSTIRNLLLDSSVSHLKEAIRVYPTHSNAWLLLGNALYKRNHKPEEVIPVYEKAAAYRVGGYYDAWFNLGIVYNESNNPLKAKENLVKAYESKPDAIDPRFLLTVVSAKLNQPDSVEYWLKKAAELRKPDAPDYYLIGTAFGKVAHNLNMSIVYLKKAIEIYPKAEIYYEDLGVAYGLNGQFDEAIDISKRLIELNPKYPASYINLAISYRNKGNKQLGDEYEQKYKDMIAAQQKK
jgi:tetratricopeptide (TPR) repeat protein